MKLDTLLVHAGATPDAETGAIVPPLHLSTTFVHGPEAELTHGYLYVRHANPTQSRLEEALAAIEGGTRALVFGSGMAAGAALLQALPAGTHVVMADDGYYDMRTIARELFPRWGLTYTLVDLTDLDAVRRAMRPTTRLVFGETPTNPMMNVMDITAIADIAHAGHAELVVDSTFATPALQRPLLLGADVVMHSMTKYLGGHSDVQGGALVWKRAASATPVEHLRTVLGAVASPFNAWMLLRGLRTLGCRMERHAHNALALAQWLEAHERVAAVAYPGLSSNAGHGIAARQMKAFGGMLSFRVREGRQAAIDVCRRVRLFTLATSLGGTESLLEHRASSEGVHTTTPDDLVRVSVGLEDIEDLKSDLAQALS